MIKEGKNEREKSETEQRKRDRKRDRKRNRKQNRKRDRKRKQKTKTEKKLRPCLILNRISLCDATYPPYVVVRGLEHRRSRQATRSPSGYHRGHRRRRTRARRDGHASERLQGGSPRNRQHGAHGSVSATREKPSPGIRFPTRLVRKASVFISPDRVGI